jgi:ATP-dependent Clp protease ATP-binding subunit ClpB
LQDTVCILQGLRKKYEAHHRVRISDEAIDAAVHLSGRYLPAKRFPDKALDLIDEAASRLRNRIESTPTLLVQVEKQMESLHNRVEAALMAGKEMAVKDELLLFRLHEEKQRLLARWREQTALLGQVFEINHEIGRLKSVLQKQRRQSHQQQPADKAVAMVETQQAVQDILHNEALMRDLYERLERTDHDLSDNNHGDHSELSDHQQQPQQQQVHQQKKNPVMEKFRNTLEARDMAEIIAQSTGIPISSMLEQEDAKSLLQMEVELQQQIVGQNEAVSVISKCIRLSRAGLRFHDRPTGVFLMLGPTVSSTTYLAD